ncbi:hypothetical protein [Aquimarina rhabdastrellae]
MSLEEDILIERFLRNELSEIESTDFLNKVDLDDDFRERFLIEKQLFESLNENEWSHVSKVDEKEFSEYDTLYNADAQRIKSVIHKATTAYDNKKKVKRLVYFSSAAAIVAFMILFNFYTDKNQLTTTQLYSEYVRIDELNSLVNRNTDAIAIKFVDAEKQFKHKNYKAALIKFDELLKLQNKNSVLYIYKALTQLELDNPNAAIKTLDSLINSDLIDAEKGYWYKGLVYLKSNEIIKAEQVFTLITQKSYFKHKEAKDVLNQLDSI